MARRVLDHMGQEEFGRFFERRIRALRQKLAVAREKVVFPQVRRQPDARRGMGAPSEAPAGRGDGWGLSPCVSQVRRSWAYEL